MVYLTLALTPQHNSHALEEIDEDQARPHLLLPYYLPTTYYLRRGPGVRADLYSATTALSLLLATGH